MSASIHRRTMTKFRMIVFGVSAAGLMIILVGAIPTAYNVSGNPGLPLAFLVVGAILGLLSVGYLAMARRVPHPAAYYAVAAQGLGRPLGVAAGFLALTAYNSILTCIYGWLGGTVMGALGGAWWMYAGLAWLLIAALGGRPVAVSVWALGSVLALTVAIATAFVIAALAHPAGGHLGLEGYSWRSLNAGAVTVVLILCVASVMGYDGTASFGLEAIERPGTPAGTAASSATMWALGLLTVGCSVMSWAMGVHYGVPQVIAATRDPDRGVPFDTLSAQYGFGFNIFTWIALVLGVLATMLSVHAVVARYGYAMARDGVLWAPIASIGSSDKQAGAFVGGSRLQSAISAATIAGFAVYHADPLNTMFPSLATLGALGLVGSLILASLAALSGLRGSDETLWVRVFAPSLGVLGGSWLFGSMLLHSNVLLGATAGSAATLVIPAILAAALVAGLLWAWMLSARRPSAYASIGVSSGSQPLAHIPGQLENVAL